MGDGLGGGRVVQERGDVCTPVADSCSVWRKPTQYCKKMSLHCCCCSTVAKSCPTPCVPGSLSLTLSQSLFRFTSTELVMLSNSLILCCPFSFCLPSFLASGSFPVSQLFTSGGPSIGASVQHQSLHSVQFSHSVVSDSL